jgi:hypothetical protein
MFIHYLDELRLQKVNLLKPKAFNLKDEKIYLDHFREKQTERAVKS